FQEDITPSFSGGVTFAMILIAIPYSPPAPTPAIKRSTQIQKKEWTKNKAAVAKEKIRIDHLNNFTFPLRSDNTPNTRPPSNIPIFEIVEINPPCAPVIPRSVIMEDSAKDKNITFKSSIPDPAKAAMRAFFLLLGVVVLAI